MSAATRYPMGTPRYYLDHNPGMTELEAHREATLFRAEAAEDERLLRMRDHLSTQLMMLCTRNPAALAVLSYMTMIAGTEIIRTGLDDTGRMWDLLARLDILPGAKSCIASMQVELAKGVVKQ